MEIHWLPENHLSTISCQIDAQAGQIDRIWIILNQKMRKGRAEATRSAVL